MNEKEMDEAAFNPRRCRSLEWALIGAGMLAAALSAGVAKAENLNVIVGPPAYSISTPKGSTIIAPLGSASPRIIAVPPIDRGRVHDLRWRLRCKPKLRMDDLGVQRFVYAKAACEFGADRDPDFETEAEDDGN